MAWEMVGPHMACVCSVWISGSSDSQLGAGCSGWEQLGGWAMPRRGGSMVNLVSVPAVRKSCRLDY